MLSAAKSISGVSWLSALAVALSAAAAVHGADLESQDKKAQAPAETRTVPERIDESYKKKEISLKESVILKAKALFAPEMLKGTEFAQTGPENKPGGYLTGFFKQVHKAYKDFTPEDKELLKKLSPDLEAIIEQREKEDKKE